MVAHGLAMSINGQDYRSNVYLLDGTLQNDFTNGPAGSATGTTLGMDTIREFRVESNAYGAEYGRNYGGQIAVLTRSGTNGIHGSLFEYHRNDALDARNYFDTAPDKPDFWRNQFGGVLGGPLQRDKLFYFVGYEGLREKLGRTITSFVLDDDARRGILPDGPAVIASAVRPYLDAIPVANGPVIGSGLATYRFGFEQQLTQDFVQGRVDFNPGPRHQFFGRYTLDDGDQRLPTDYPQFPRTFLSRNQFFTGEYRNVWSDRTLQTFRVGFSRTRVGQNVEARWLQPDHDRSERRGQPRRSARPVRGGPRPGRRHRHRRHAALRTAELRQPAARSERVRRAIRHHGHTRSAPPQGRRPRRALPRQHGEPDVQPGDLHVREPACVPRESAAAVRGADTGRSDRPRLALHAARVLPAGQRAAPPAPDADRRAPVRVQHDAGGRRRARLGADQPQ